MFNNKEKSIIENLSDRFSSIYENKKSKEDKTTSSTWGLGGGIKFPIVYDYPKGLNPQKIQDALNELEQNISEAEGERTEGIVQIYPYLKEKGFVVNDLQDFYVTFEYFNNAEKNGDLPFITRNLNKLSDNYYRNYQTKGYDWQNSKELSEILRDTRLFLIRISKNVRMELFNSSEDQRNILLEMKYGTEDKDEDQRPLLDFDRMMKNRKHPYMRNKFLSKYYTTFQDWNMELLYEYIDILGLQKEANKLFKTTDAKTTKEALFKYLYEPRSNPSYFVASNQDELERLHSLFSQVKNAVEKDISIFESDIQAEESKSKPNQNAIKELKDRIRRRSMLVNELNKRLKVMEK